MQCYNNNLIIMVLQLVLNTILHDIIIKCYNTNKYKYEFMLVYKCYLFLILTVKL